MRDDGEEAGRRVGQSAERPGLGAGRREASRPPSGGKPPGPKTARRQFHLSERTAQRLGVHCSLADRNESAVVEEILASWLCRYGKGKVLWASGGREDSSPDTPEDRQDKPAA